MAEGDKPPKQRKRRRTPPIADTLDARGVGTKARVTETPAARHRTADHRESCRSRLGAPRRPERAQHIELEGKVVDAQQSKYGTLYTRGFPGGPPLARHPGPYSIATASGYEYRQDRVLAFEKKRGTAALEARAVMAALQENPNRFFPFSVIGHQGEQGIILGREYTLTNRPSSQPIFGIMPSPLPKGGFPIRVTEVTPDSFTFTTLPGHFDPPGSTITFTTRADQSGAIHLEHFGAALGGTPASREVSAQFIAAPTAAARTWDVQAANLRRWLVTGE